MISFSSITHSDIIPLLRFSCLRFCTAVSLPCCPHKVLIGRDLLPGSPDEHSHAGTVTPAHASISPGPGWRS